MAQEKEIKLVYKYIKKINLQPGEGVDLGCGWIESKIGNEDKQICPEVLIGIDRNIQQRPDICADVTLSGPYIGGASSGTTHSVTFKISLFQLLYRIPLDTKFRANRAALAVKFHSE